MRLSASFGSDQALIEIMRKGRSPEERAAAASALLPYVLRSYDARKALRECLTDSNEEDSVRREAAKSLAYAVNDSDVREDLRDTAGSTRESEDLRAICLKAMFRMTNSEARTLLDVLEDGNESVALRRAAAWGLFKAGNQVEVRRALQSVAQDRREETALREDALKSLFEQSHTVEIRGLFLDMAQDQREESSLRAIATLALIKRSWETEVIRVLENIYARDPEPGVRLAALTALDRRIDERVAGVFHLDQLSPSHARNPLLYE
ncbi:MAG: HEAT repeat domain-containing protein [Elusimicrobia bacterium]|nr:HEAT repeat domain-containing protein [Elusimicrobiota bacterium]